MVKFNMKSCTTPQKRPVEEEVSVMKVPRVAQLTLVEQGPRPQTAQRLPDKAPVVLTIYKVTEQAGDAWSSFEGMTATLYQIQIKHEARPSPLYNITQSFNEFLQYVHGNDESVPTNLQDLQKAGIKLTLTDGQDPDSVLSILQ